ncbi:MAG: signal peptidase II [Dermatophilaceae bacterium]
MPLLQGEGGARLIDTPDPANAGRPARRLFALVAVLALTSYAADQASKAWAVAALTDAPPRDLVGSVLRLVLIRNPGAAFSIGTGNTWVLSVLAVVVLVVVVRTSRRLGSLGWAWAFGLLLGGALGNLTDRLTRPPSFGQGHVIDFIDYNGWFVGNVADIVIVAAAGLIAVLAQRGIGVDGRRQPRATRHTGPQS